MHPYLNTAIKAARRAGSVINRSALDGAPLEVHAKQANDFVTQVDKAAERAAIDIIRRAYPDHAILAEESGEDLGGEPRKGGAKPSKPAAPDTRWIIDPLDGTTNFIHGFPQYCVSIAVEHRGRVEHAVVYDPSKNELFTASQGRGAFLNDRRMRVTKCLQLRDALVGTGFPFKEMARVDQYLRQLETIMRGASGIRRAGAAALDLAYVACGRLDGFWEMGLAPWDMAAGALLITEAGGLVGDLQGGQTYLASGDIAAGTPKVFPELLAALR
jgi:myo-inositol-1(or 4)-monophosphatase